MGSFRRRMYEEHGHQFTDDERFEVAYRKVKRIKGFYSHLKVYFIVNVIIILSSLNRDLIGNNFRDSGIFEWHTYATAFYWGIAVLIHAFTVFGMDRFFSDEWEQKKIQKYMDEKKSNTSKWE